MNDQKSATLLQILKQHTANGIAVAFSGGTDSTFLLKILAQLQQEQFFHLEALYMHSIFQTEQELHAVQELATEFGVPLKIFSMDPIQEIPEIKNNPPDRCYFCKKNIFTKFLEYTRQKHIATLVDGTNSEDLNHFRPGLRALKELSVFSPLAEAGMTKKDIRQYSAELHLPTA